MGSDLNTVGRDDWELRLRLTQHLFEYTLQFGEFFIPTFAPHAHVCARMLMIATSCPPVTVYAHTIPRMPTHTP